jgi:hypothetical protein
MSKRRWWTQVQSINTNTNITCTAISVYKRGDIHVGGNKHITVVNKYHQLQQAAMNYLSGVAQIRLSASFLTFWEVPLCG